MLLTMRKNTSALGLCFFVLGLTACSTFSREQCEEMDWQQQGRQTALRGHTAGQGVGYFKKECGDRHGVALNEPAFSTGYSAGLKEFCSPEFSYRFAAEGGTYLGTCPQTDEKQMLDRYRSGRLLFLEKKVAELTSRVESLESENSSLISELSSCRSQTPSCPPPPSCPSSGF